MVRVIAALIAAWSLVALSAHGQAEDRSAVRPGDFNGKYVGSLAGQMRVRLECDAGRCTLIVPDSPAMVYGLISPLPARNYAEAENALKYAQDHKDGKSEEVVKGSALDALLHSSAKIRTCLDLRQTNNDPPAYTILCNLDGTPWQKPSVLYMGTILANCGPVFCRFGMLPMFME